MYDLLLISAIIAGFFLTFIIIYKRPHELLNQLFAVGLLGGSVWMMCIFALYSSFGVKTLPDFKYWSDLAFVAGCIGLSFITYFFCIFPDRRTRMLPTWFTLFWLGIMPVLISYLTYSGWLFAGIYESEGKFFIKAAPGYIVFSLYSLTGIIGSFVVLIRKRKRFTGVKKLQITYVLLGFGLTLVFIIASQAFIPLIIYFFPQMLWLSRVYQYAPFYTIFLFGFTFYSMIKHRLMDVELIISRTVGYAVATAVIVSIYIVVVTLFDRIVLGLAGRSTSSFGAFSALIIAFLFHPLQHKVHDYVYGRFFAKRFEYQKLLLDTSRSILTILNLEELIAYFMETVRVHMGVEQMSFLMRNDDAGSEEGTFFYVRSSQGLPEEVVNHFELRNGAIGWFEEKRNVLVRHELELDMDAGTYKRIYGNMDKLQAELMVPVFTKGSLSGILTMSRKRDGRAYSQQDIDILNILSAEVGIGIDNARLYGEAITDSLSGLFNRRYFDYRLEEELLRAHRYHRSLALLMIDIDHFKHVNDNYGHPAGDFVLQHIGYIIRNALRKVDIVCRYGGEEIAVILPETGNVETDTGAGGNNACILVAERIRKQVAEHKFVFGKDIIPITVSIGVTYCYNVNQQMVSMTELIDKADKCLYEAKTAGRNCIKGMV